MGFVQLTRVDTGRAVWVCADLITHIEECDKGRSRISIHGATVVLCVDESVTDVLELLKTAELDLPG